MSTPAIVRTVVGSARWIEIDWAMKAVSLAMHHAARLNMPDVFESLRAVHDVLQARRDRA